MRRLILVLLLMPLLLGQAYNVPFNPPAAAPNLGAHIYDDFETDSSANWTGYGDWDGTPGTFYIDNGNDGMFTSTAHAGSAIHDTPMTTATGYMCVQWNADEFLGPKFRASSNESDRSYIIRMTPDDDIIFRHCLIDSCTTIDTENISGFGLGDRVGFIYSGIGSSTQVVYYYFDNATTDYCPGCDGSDCDTSGWAATADSSGTLTCDAVGDCGTGTNPELDTNRYVGLYNGNTDAVAFDEFYAGDD